jgi:AcrR family transcriptional regulator
MMGMNKKTESAARTRQALERAARDLFEQRGFAAVSAEEIVAAADVTRGALYHHYGGKEGLFEAVAEAAMRRLHENIAQAAAAGRDPLAALKLGISRFLELATAARLQRVLFIDAPTVLGWQRWREMDARYGLGMLQRGLEQAQSSGQMRRQDTRLLAHMLLSSLIEAAMLVARAPIKATARAEAEEMLLRLLAGLL